jgi:hypothetical protein
LGVNYGATNSELIDFIEAHNIQFPCASGIHGMGNDVNEQYGIMSYITCIVVTPDREIAGQFFGPYYPERDTLNHLLLSLGAEMQSCSVGISENEAEEEVKLFPNPITESVELYVEINKSGTYHIRVVNGLGQQVARFVDYLTIGENRINVDFSSLDKGMYIVDIQYENKLIISKKILKQ